MSSVTQSARDRQNFARRWIFYRSAREGFQDFLRTILTPENNRVLLPAFIGWSPREGSGVFDPVRATGADARFYGLRDDLQVDIDRLEHALEQYRPRVLVLIHYFGRTEPLLERVAELADRYGALLVEDLAHGFFSTLHNPAIGRAPVSLFSLHKMFATDTGGMMQYNDPTLLKDQRETAPELARLILDYDWNGIAARRRRNFRLILEQLQALPELDAEFRLLWPELSPGDAPQSLPVSIDNGSRDRIYTAMNAEGFGMTSLYHTLINDVQADHPDMVRRSKTITNFPVHQDVDEATIPAMIASFRRALTATV